jgi:small subunit ribosomal protein S20
MPNKPSALKALRQSKKRYIYNLRIKRGVREAVKTARKAIDAKSSDAGQFLRKAVTLLDKAAQKKVIKKNTASRYASRLSRAFKKRLG